MGWFSKLIGNDKVQEDIYLMQDEIEHLNDRVHLAITLLGECITELNNIKEKLEKSTDKIEYKLKNIPKEIAVKNILSIW